jgi:hypothetical protein
MLPGLMRRQAAPALAKLANHQAGEILVKFASAEDAASAPGGPQSGPPETAVVPLAKATGWREGLGGVGGEDFFILLEIAFDPETAQLAWAENVPDDLPERSGEPAEEGRYGDLAEVDFDTHAVVVWSSGESGSCPQWLSAINTTGEGRVEATTTEQTEGLACTDDFNAYRMVVAAPRDRLPEPSWLPEDDVSHNGRVLDWGGLVREYPAE